MSLPVPPLTGLAMPVSARAFLKLPVLSSCELVPSAYASAVALIAALIRTSVRCARMFLQDGGVDLLASLLALCPSSYITPELFASVVQVVCAITGAIDPDSAVRKHVGPRDVPAQSSWQRYVTTRFHRTVVMY